MHPQATPTPAERRRLRQRTEVRRSILAATEELLVAGGYEGFSMRRLAERCAYTAPTIYHHFGGKRGLIDALLEERFRQMVERIRRVPTADDPLETLRRQLGAFVRFGIENPTHYRLLTVPRLDDESPPPQSAEDSRSLIEVTLSQLARDGRLQVDEIEEAVQCIWVMLHGLVAMRISRPDYAWTASHVDVSLEILLRGLVAPARAAVSTPTGAAR
jgi:AcrR family transcriptional regulator